MKYQTFNRSCAYAGLANMLMDYSIDVEDRDIVLKAYIPFMFGHDKAENKYMAGPMLQGKKWFDLYLNGIGFEFLDKYYDIEGAIKFLSSTKERAMIGLKKDDTGRHAVVFIGMRDGGYFFLNNKHKETKEKEELVFRKDELYDVIDDDSVIGYISAIESKRNVDYYAEMMAALDTLERYREDVVSFISAKRTIDEIMSAKRSLFEALMLDVVSMLDIIGEKELLNKIIDLRGKYSDALQQRTELVLKECIPVNDINSVIDMYKNIIMKKMAQVASI